MKKASDEPAIENEDIQHSVKEKTCRTTSPQTRLVARMSF